MLKVATDPSRLFVAVLTNPANRRLLKALTEQDWAPEVLAIGARVAYLWCPLGGARAGSPRPSPARSATR